MVSIANTEVIENLGQVDLCICDKTGTLTKNELIIRELYTDNRSFMIKYEESDASKNDQVSEPKIRHENLMLVRNFINAESAMQRQNIFLCMALCHTAIVSKHKVGMNGSFISESEDELALLSFAKHIGFRFTKKVDDEIHLKIYGADIMFRVVTQLPFDPVRKMMSIIVET